MPRPSNSEERREQIVEALLRVMAEQGYERASINDIAKTAGLASGLVHYHFKSKQEILLRLIDRLEALADERVQKRLAKATDPLARVDAFIDAHLARSADADPAVVACWVAVAGESIRQPPVAEKYQQVVSRGLATLTGIVTECLPEARVKSAPAIAAGLYAAIQGYFILAAAAPEAIPAGSAAPTVRQMARGLIHETLEASVAKSPRR